MSATRAESSKEQIKMSLPARITSADFRKRAQDHGFAAALTDIPQVATMFDELAAMFDQIARRFGRAQRLPSPKAHQKAH